MSRAAVRTVTMADVAREAGVSQPTVSRALNGDTRVATRTRTAVLEAADRLGYVINRAARTLAGSSTNSIGFVIAEHEAHVWGNPYIPRIISGISRELGEQGKQLVLYVAQNRHDQEKLIQHVSRERTVDGFLMITDNRSDHFLRFLLERHVPVVVGGRPLGLKQASYVDVDNIAGSVAATSHLLDVGCRRIGMITGPQTTGAGVDRLVGYRRTLVAHDLKDSGAVYCAKDWGIEEGYSGMLEVLQEQPDLDGVFAAGELLALGALSALRAAGRRVPDDVRFVGFDDSPAASRSDPPLSCVAQPVEELGQQMAALLLRQLAGQEETRHLMLPVQLNARASTLGRDV
ncbi:LacI family DNA-binding transcriptional regulator [Nocardioides sp. MAHUQ-72]|uniref:LacI family DNA-binding transcriptional regulator n=1 Tax=unclassified Nocardioides TaxID=2615069 RepID=UPI00360B017A